MDENRRERKKRKRKNLPLDTRYHRVQVFIGIEVGRHPLIHGWKGWQGENSRDLFAYDSLDGLSDGFGAGSGLERVTRIFIKRYEDWNEPDENQYLIPSWEYAVATPAPLFPLSLYCPRSVSLVYIRGPPPCCRLLSREKATRSNIVVRPSERRIRLEFVLLLLRPPNVNTNTQSFEGFEKVSNRSKSNLEF